MKFKIYFLCKLNRIWKKVKYILSIIFNRNVQVKKNAE